MASRQRWADVADSPVEGSPDSPLPDHSPLTEDESYIDSPSTGSSRLKDIGRRMQQTSLSSQSPKKTGIVSQSLSGSPGKRAASERRQNSNRPAKGRSVGNGSFVSVNEPVVISIASLLEPEPNIHESGSASSSSMPEENWRRREQKRQGVVVATKATPAYQAYQRLKESGDVFLQIGDGMPAPSTPDPTDRRISKRRWEEEVRIWRLFVRQSCPNQNDEMQEPSWSASI